MTNISHYICYFTISRHTRYILFLFLKISELLIRTHSNQKNTTQIGKKNPIAHSTQTFFQSREISDKRGPFMFGGWFFRAEKFLGFEVEFSATHPPFSVEPSNLELRDRKCESCVVRSIFIENDRFFNERYSEII